MENMKPILFNSEMVQVIQKNLKTTTRRIIKPKYDNCDVEWFSNKGGTHLVYAQNDVEKPVYDPLTKKTSHKLRAYEEIKEPYNKSDVLWVRETWAAIQNDGEILQHYEYRADTCNPLPGGWPKEEKENTTLRWKPSIFMPRAAARIMLQVNNIKAERLQDITDEEAIKEGCLGIKRDCQASQSSQLNSDTESDPGSPSNDCGNSGYILSPKLQFAKLWDSIYSKPAPIKENGKILHFESYPWIDIQETKEYKGLPWIIKGNPFVWAIGFIKLV